MPLASAPVHLLDSVPAALAWLRQHGVRALGADSRRLQPGDAFIAWPGHALDARQYVRQALAGGARACLVEAQGVEAFAFGDEPRVAAMSGLKAATGDIASAFIGDPSRRLRMVAATGTNGKTSTAWWTAQALSSLGRRCGVIGTLGVGEPSSAAHPTAGMQPTGLTTPDPITLQGALRNFADQGFEACAIEASSIGIVEHRLAGTHIDVALFTNFTQDHLDYHGTMDAYWRAKTQLFDHPGLKAAVNHAARTMNRFDEQLEEQLEQLRADGLYRELRRVESPQGARVSVSGQSLLNFSSNDYLGLAHHPALCEAASRASTEWGAGSGASRLICGSLGVHHELEEALAAFKGTEASLTFSTGYATAIGTIGALLDKDDILIIDKLVHACVVDAARLCGAKLRVFAHNDPNDLEKKLQWAAARTRNSKLETRNTRILIVTESVFSMDGDLAPLREIIELKDNYGAWLMLDEAHATGLFGEHRRGLAEACELAHRVEIQMGTLGKALGAAGGYICGSRPLIDLLINRARSFIFSTAPVPAASAAATAAIRLVQSEEGEVLRARLWKNVDHTKNTLINAGWALPPVQSAIIPLMVGDESKAVELAAALREQNIFTPAIRYPTVARGAARLRLTVTAAHTAEDIATLGNALRLTHHATRTT